MKSMHYARGTPLGLGVLVGMLCSLPLPPVHAGEPSDNDHPKKADQAEADGKKKADKKKDKPDFPPFEEVIEDHKKIPGFIDLYYDKKKDHLLGVIPSATLGKDFLLASSIAGGPALTGFTWQTQVVRWQEMDKKLVLIEPDLRYNRAEKSTVSDAVARTYTDRIVLSTKIVSKRGGDPVIDLDKVFKSDRAHLGRIYGGSVDSSLSKWAKTKGFEKNVELAVDLAIMNERQGGTRARVHYSISELPKTDYKPRRADDRVGYFLTAIKNWGKDHKEKTVFDRFVRRWHLRKADPEEKVSDVHPDDQIVFYIEKTVPVKFRRYVREGILLWNDAFEKAGLRNVMAVRQQTDTNEFKDLDPEDVRYNFFRWIVSGRAFAMGPSRMDPRTGEILDADIVMDDALVRSLLAQYGRLGAKGPAAGYDPQLQEFLTRYPQWDFMPQEQALTPTSVRQGGSDLSWHPSDGPLISGTGGAKPAWGPSPAFGEGSAPMVPGDNYAACRIADGLRHEMALAGFVLKSEGLGGLSDKFVGEFVRWVVAHEVGHTLGLRHNFKASTWKSVDELMAASGDEATGGSVMDYTAAMYAHGADDQPRFFSPKLGPYDYWAIQYGYRHTDEEYKDEKELLKAIASRGNEPGLAYATDEDAGFFSPDPLVNRWDNASDPIEYAKHRMELVKRLQSNIEEWAVKEGESYSYLRRVFDALLFEYGRAARVAARVIGGQYVARNHKGDPNEVPPFEIVPVEKQQEALRFLITNVFSDEAFRFSPELLNKLGPGRWRHWDTDDYDSLREYPLHDRIAAVQYWALFQLVNPFTLARIYDAELKVPADQEAMTVADLMSKTTAAVWSELTRTVGSTRWTTRQPFVSSVRRSLQRAHLRALINIVLAPPGRTMPADAHAVARMMLKGLSQQIGQYLDLDTDGNLDPMTRAHLDGAKARIDKALDADFEL